MSYKAKGFRTCYLTIRLVLAFGLSSLLPSQQSRFAQLLCRPTLSSLLLDRSPSRKSKHCSMLSDRDYIQTATKDLMSYKSERFSDLLPNNPPCPCIRLIQPTPSQQFRFAQLLCRPTLTSANIPATDVLALCPSPNSQPYGLWHAR